VPFAWVAVLLAAVAIGGALLLVFRPFVPADGAGLERATQPASAPTTSVLPTISTPAQTPILHVVASGDTLRSIAERYLGDEALWERVYQANRDVIEDPERLTVGQTLEIPAR
jgi:nucleoid-associated protein YgaU